MTEERPLESRLFGVHIRRAEVAAATDVPRALAHFRETGGDLLVLRAPALATSAIHAIEGASGRLCDVILESERRVTAADRSPAIDLPAGVTARWADVGDAGLLHELGRRAFAGFCGHWHADPRLDRDRCDELYARWAHDLGAGASSIAPVLVLESADRVVVGFLALTCDAQGQWAVPLTAVAPEARGNGLLRSMLSIALGAVADGDGRALAYETQVTNAGALDAVVRSGFVPRRSRLTFHLWAGPA